MKLFTPTVASLAMAVLCGSSLRAQVFINEVDFTPGASWIELYNDGDTAVELSNWSMYHATKTAFRPGDYWWPFPVGTSIKSKDFLRLHWATAVQTGSDPRQIYTGRSNWNYLFGHGYEDLDPAQGALAICKTKSNTQVNAQNIFADWIQWGDTGFARESLAISNLPVSLWNPNTFLPAAPTDKSVIRIEFLDSLPHRLDSYRLDTSPTPLEANAADFLVNIYGDSCSWLHPTGTHLRVDGIPYHGNTDFKLTTTGTLGPTFFESMLYIINVSGATQDFSFCKGVVLDTASNAVTTPFFPTRLGSTTLDIPLTDPSAKGAMVFIQSVSFGVGYFSFSDRLQLRLSK